MHVTGVGMGVAYTTTVQFWDFEPVNRGSEHGVGRDQRTVSVKFLICLADFRLVVL